MFQQVRCPEVACAGWVCDVGDPDGVIFFGCGECGNVWRSEQALAKAIEAAIARSPFRSKAYTLIGNAWRDNPPGSTATDYAQHIAKEWSDAG